MKNRCQICGKKIRKGVYLCKKCLKKWLKANKQWGKPLGV